jgi:putative transposase
MPNPFFDIHLQPELKEELCQIYEAVDLESARSIRDRIIQTYEAKAPKATAILDEAFDDITAVLALPLKYRKRLRTTNSVERLNQEIRRRERVIRIFPNTASVIRLMGALLMEQDERWQTGRKYFDMQLYYQILRKTRSPVLLHKTRI